MTSAISAAPPAPVQPPLRPPDVDAKSAGPSSQQQAALKQLLSKYSASLAHGAPASSLSSLGRQISAMAQSMGQNVRLPSGGASAAPPAPAAGKVNVTA